MSIYGGYDDQEHQDHIQKAGGTTSASDSLSTKADATATRKPAAPVDTNQVNTRINNNATQALQNYHRMVTSSKGFDNEDRTAENNRFYDETKKMYANQDTINKVRSGQIPSKDADARSKIPLKGIK